MKFNSEKYKSFTQETEMKCTSTEMAATWFGNTICEERFQSNKCMQPECKPAACGKEDKAKTLLRCLNKVISL